MSSTKTKMDAPWRIALVQESAKMGGVEFSTLYLAQHLDRSRWYPLVICSEKGDLPDACREAEVDVRILPQPPIYQTSFWVGDSRVPNPAAWLLDVWSVLVATRSLAKFLYANHINLVITKGFFAHIYGGLAARRVGVPCIWHLQDFITERHMGFYKRLFSYAAQRIPTYIIADGSPIAHQLPDALQHRISVVHNGVDTSTFHPNVDSTAFRLEFGIPRDALVIGHVARLIPWKGQHHLIEAFASTAQQYPEAHLLLVGAPVFVGDAYQRRLQRLVQQFGLEERVTFAGFRHDLPQALAAMNIFAYTAVEKDTSPLALLSAMAAGLPIVAFGIDGIREVLDESVDSVLVEPKDIASLEGALCLLLQDPSLRQQLANGARQRAVEHFSLDKYTAACQQVLEQVLSDQKTTPR